MFVSAVILAVLLAVLFVGGGVAKVAGHEAMESTRARLGLASGMWKLVGGLEMLGAAGVLIGLHGELVVIGVLAAAGLVGMTIGAVAYHQKAHDGFIVWLPAVAVGSLASFYAIVRVASA